MPRQCVERVASARAGSSCMAYSSRIRGSRPNETTVLILETASIAI